MSNNTSTVLSMKYSREGPDWPKCLNNVFNDFVVKMECKAHNIPKCSIESFLPCCQFCILCEVCRFHDNGHTIKKNTKCNLKNFWKPDFDIYELSFFVFMQIKDWNNFIQWQIYTIHVNSSVFKSHHIINLQNSSILDICRFIAYFKINLVSMETRTKAHIYKWST